MSLRKAGTHVPNDTVLHLWLYMHNHNRANFWSLISIVSMYKQVKHLLYIK